MQTKITSARGFTLVELIIVIVILGILAATAAPKFLDIQEDATEATLDGLKASIETAVNITNAKTRADGVNKQDDVNIQNENDETIRTSYGYPNTEWANTWEQLLRINVTATNSGDACSTEYCVDESHNIRTLLGGDGAPPAAETAMVFYPQTYTKNDECIVYYIFDENKPSAKEAGEPVIGTISTGC